MNELHALETHLQCPICHDLINGAVVLRQCQHRFCSFCIRKYLVHKSQCPQCNGNASTVDIVSDNTFCLIVESFSKLKAAFKDSKATRSSKRRRVSEINQGVNLETEASEVTAEPSSAAPAQTSSTKALSAGSRVECPICAKKVDPDFINQHLDMCLNGDGRAPTSAPPKHVSVNQDRTSGRTPPSPPNGRTTSPQVNGGHLSKPQETRRKLPTLLPHMMKPAELKKKLAEFGFSGSGIPKPEQEKRLSEFILRWNASCDSIQPKSKEQIVKDVLDWEKRNRHDSSSSDAVSRMIDNVRTEEDHEKFRTQVLASNRGDFDRLIQETKKRQLVARRKREQEAREKEESEAPKT
eukprot:Clim_evm37s218 gene=Clim_evmTU37s218